MFRLNNDCRGIGSILCFAVYVVMDTLETDTTTQPGGQPHWEDQLVEWWGSNVCSSDVESQMQFQLTRWAIVCYFVLECDAAIFVHPELACDVRPRNMQYTCRLHCWRGHCARQLYLPSDGDHSPIMCTCTIAYPKKQEFIPDLLL